MAQWAVPDARAKEAGFKFPVKCAIGTDCWLLNYVDNDPSNDWHDFEGKKRTYDGHRGLDIAIQNLEQMQKGVAVLAAADGNVIAVRDGVPDMNALINTRQDLEDIGCGNRVAIRHQNGVITDYCHMKQGSILVKKNDRIAAGQKIGEIGLSGLTEFPHLHFGIMNHHLFFDPFTGQPQYQGKKPFHPLWQKDVMQRLQKSDRHLYNAGVSDSIPDWISIRGPENTKTDFSARTGVLILWADLIHVKKNDILEFSISGPDKQLFLKKQMIIHKPNVKKLLYTGKRIPSEGFQAGLYEGTIQFIRSSKAIKEIQPLRFTVYPHP